MTGTSKAVRWLAISREGRARATRGGIRGASTSPTNGRATASRKQTRAQRIVGRQGQRGNTASSVRLALWLETTGDVVDAAAVPEASTGLTLISSGRRLSKPRRSLTV